MDVVTALRELTQFDHAAKRASLRPRSRVWLYWGPAMCVLAVGFITLQAMALIEYAQTCDVLLHRS